MPTKFEEKNKMNEGTMDWTQAWTIIGSILIPTLSGFAWMIHRMDQKFDKVDAELNRISDRINGVEIKLSNLDMRVGFLERLFEMLGSPFKIGQSKDRTDP
jgi:hypothetical protein